MIELSRHYFHHKTADFHKRVSEICSIPGFQIFEYLGTIPKAAPHGNRVHPGHPYVRSKSATFAAIRGEEQHLPPLQIYSTLMKRDLENAPRNKKQVENSMYRGRTQRGEIPKHENVADQVADVEKMLHVHPFVTKIVHRRGQMPLIILSTDEQLFQISRFCLQQDDGRLKTPLGIDRTFNLSSCYVTVTVFKELDVLKADTGEHPIFIGPVLLQWDAFKEAYIEFFNELKIGLTNVRKELSILPLPNILFGSDQESGIISARKSAFPDASHLFCIQHLKDNFLRMLDSNGIPPRDRTAFCRSVFDEFEKDPTEERVDTIATELAEMMTDLPKGDKVLRYFQNHIRQILVDQSKIHVEEATAGSWTNNNCESINNLLKVQTKRKICTIPELIEQIWSIVDRQQTDLMRSLYNEGEYVLVETAKKYRIPKTLFLSLSPNEQKCFLDAFLKGRPPKLPSGCTSKDGIIHLPINPKTAGKPGQRTRPSSTRTASRYFLLLINANRI